MITAALSLGAGVFNAVSSGFSYFSSGNYVKLVKEAGTGGVAILKTAGHETRATLEKADVTAKHILSGMKETTDGIIRNAETGTLSVIKSARDSASAVMLEGGEEFRHSAQFVKLKADQILDKVARESELAFEKAGLEARKSIQLCGKEARESCLLLSSEMGRNIHLAGDETVKVFKAGSEEIKSILEVAKKNIKELNQDISGSCLKIIDHSLEKVQGVIQSSVQTVDKSLTGLIGQVEKVAHGVILDFGQQGKMLIQETGQEIRITANAILAQAFAGQETMIRCAGDECKLVVAAAGKEVRSTLYVIPRIASKAAQAAAESFMHGLKNALWTQSDLQVISHMLKTHCTVSENVSILPLLEFVKDQNQLNPAHKAELYKLLIQIFNDPGLDIKIRFEAHVFIGVAGLLDKGLFERAYCGLSRNHYGKLIIDKIPGKAKEILLERGVDSLEVFLPEPKEIELPKIEILEPNPIVIKLEEQRLLTLEWQSHAEEDKRELALVKLDHEERMRALQLQNEVKRNEELQSQQRQIEEMKSELARQKQEKEDQLQSLKMRMQEEKEQLEKQYAETIRSKVTEVKETQAALGAIQKQLESEKREQARLGENFKLSQSSIGQKEEEYQLLLKKEAALKADLENARRDLELETQRVSTVKTANEKSLQEKDRLLTQKDDEIKDMRTKIENLEAQLDKWKPKKK